MCLPEVFIFSYAYNMNIMNIKFVSLAVMMMCLSAQSFGYSGKLTYAQGEVTVISGGKSSKAQKETSVLAGDSVKTGPQSLAIIVMDDGAQLKLNENSNLEIPLKEEGTVSLKSGSVFSKIPKQKLKNQFKVVTPTAVMGVRGTHFFTAYGTNVDHPSDAWMCVEEGSVGVTTKNSKKVVIVNKGEGVLVTDKKGVTPPQKYAWTKKLNWNLDPASGTVENKLEISYKETLLKEDYN